MKKFHKVYKFPGTYTGVEKIEWPEYEEQTVAQFLLDVAKNKHIVLKGFEPRTIFVVN